MLKVDLVPAQRHQLAHPEPVAVGEEDEGRIPVAVPADSAGVSGIGRVCLTPDGASYVYSYTRVLSDLYVVDGLR